LCGTLRGPITGEVTQEKGGEGDLLIKWKRGVYPLWEEQAMPEYYKVGEGGGGEGSP